MSNRASNFFTFGTVISNPLIRELEMAMRLIVFIIIIPFIVAEGMYMCV